MWWECILAQNVQCHSQTVGHRRTCHETAFHKMCNVTYLLLVMSWACLSQDVQFHSHPVGHRKACDEKPFHKMCNVTYFLLVIGKHVMRWSFKKMCHVTHLLLVMKRCNEIAAFQKMCNVTHRLLIKDIMWWDCCLSENVQCHLLAVCHRKRWGKTVFQKCAMPLTDCWS